MSLSLAHDGLEAVKNKDWERGVDLLSKALKSSDSPTWLLARSHAYSQLKRYNEALRDAELAYHVAAGRGSGKSRSDMIDAQYRRAVALFKLGRYADSDCCAKWSMLLASGKPVNENDGTEQQVDADGNYTAEYKEEMKNAPFPPGNAQASGSSTALGAAAGAAKKTGFENQWNRAYAWRSQSLRMLETLPADHPGRKVGVTKIPLKPKKEEPAPEPDSDSDIAEAVPKAAPAKPTPAPGSVSDEKMKTRVDFYQNNQNVTISLFVKDVKKEDLKVELFKKHVSNLDPRFGENG